jgi:hypothetical protein
MRAAAAVIGFLGVGNVLAPLVCVDGCTAVEGIFYALGFIGGLCLLATAYGIWQRLLWAWRFGFWVLGFAGAFFVARAAVFPPRGPTGDSLTNVLIAALMGCVVSLGLAFWWYRWRNRFVGVVVESNNAMDSDTNLPPI